MAQQVKTLITKPISELTEINPQEPHVGRRELTVVSCPMSPRVCLECICPQHPHITMYTFKDEIVLKSSLMFREYVCGNGEKVRKINGQYFRTQTKFRHNFN